MAVNNPGTHVTHCCGLHGCKYGDEECPVESGELLQEYACEYCRTVSKLTEKIEELKYELEFAKALAARKGK